MRLLIKLDRIVIVEGKYDKINLENYIDAIIVRTNGFGIYKDMEKQKLIKRLCKKSGAIIITDSDNAGAQIRAFIKNLCKNDNIINVYLPQISGKENRKSSPSKQGFLGAEGLSGDIIIDALKKSGLTADKTVESQKITKTDLYALGLSGCAGSKQARDDFASYAALPVGLSSNAFLDALNTIYTREVFIKEAELWRQEQARN